MNTPHIHFSSYMLKRATTQRRIYTPDNTPINTLRDYHEPQPGWHGMGGPTTPQPVAPQPVAPQPGHVVPGKGISASTTPGTPTFPRLGVIDRTYRPEPPAPQPVVPQPPAPQPVVPQPPAPQPVVPQPVVPQPGTITAGEITKNVARTYRPEPPAPQPGTITAGEITKNVARTKRSAWS